MKKCALYFITGSSGSGKTTLLKGINKTIYPNLQIYYSDEFGVPSTEEMTINFGNPEQWQAHNIHQLIMKTDHLTEENLAVFDIQARPTVIFDEANRAGVYPIHITLIECSHEERRKRLIEFRTQPELDSLDMYAWASYLRGQADALKLEIIDTTNQSVEDSIKELAKSIGSFAEENGISLKSLLSKNQ
jgi:energy-coupling factor transporter ATP-binding protein EcfA2